MTQFRDIILQKNSTPKLILEEFIEAEKIAWPLAKANFDGLQKVKVKHFQFDGFQVKVQYNPERLLSTVSKTDKQSIAARKCFLCRENRPQEQEEIEFGDQFLILINPYPIFRNHFTITKTAHTEQLFLLNSRMMLDLAFELKGFTVLYNGPECGASAPDHMHFQAGENEFLPLSSEFNTIKESLARTLYSKENTKVFAFDNYLRKLISVETDSAEKALMIIGIFHKHFHATQPEKMEPMMNVLCSYESDHWFIHLFPRQAHRPSHYFEKGENQILISPGSVDFGGVFVTPRLEDFEKITQENIVEILSQVCISDEAFADLTAKMKAEISRI